jgi:hypothetical protein
MMQVQQHRQLIEEMVGDRIFSLQYEGCLGEDNLFHYPFLAQTALIIGAAGSCLNEDEEPEELTQLRVETDPKRDKEEMELILRRAKNRLEIPDDRFKANIDALDRIYNKGDGAGFTETLQGGKEVIDSPLLDGFIPPAQMS